LCGDFFFVKNLAASQTDIKSTDAIPQAKSRNEIQDDIGKGVHIQNSKFNYSVLEQIS
jgi:hypothetical protein